MTRRSVTTLLVDIAAFLVGYAVVSRYLTGGGIVDVRLITDGQEPTYTVVASIVTMLVAVLLVAHGSVDYEAPSSTVGVYVSVIANRREVPLRGITGDCSCHPGR